MDFHLSKERFEHQIASDDLRLQFCNRVIELTCLKPGVIDAYL